MQLVQHVSLRARSLCSCHLSVCLFCSVLATQLFPPIPLSLIPPLSARLRPACLRLAACPQVFRTHTAAERLLQQQHK